MGPDGKQIGYGDVAAEAMALPVPEKVALKDISAFRYIGKSTGRLDTEAKSTGTQRFGMDAKRPGMKTVLIARPPYFGGTVANMDDSDARAVRGVVQVMRVPLERGSEGVAIVADGYWQAKLGRDALKVTWNKPASLPDSGRLTEEFTALPDQPGLPARPADTSKIEGAPKNIEAQFRFPFLAHSPMEPLNAVIEVTGSGESMRCDIWSGTRFQTIDQGTVAAVMGVPAERVTIHTEFPGGGFGRRATPTADYLADTAKVMKTWARRGRTEPLKLIWSREDDVRGGYYRPFTMHKATIGVDTNGSVAGWHHRIVSPSILKGAAFEAFLVEGWRGRNGRRGASS